MYATNEETRNRLLNTLVVHGGRPLLVVEVVGEGENISLTCREWPFGTRSTMTQLRLDDPAFNRFVTPRLGFANVYTDGNRHTLWCQRTPTRRMHQGLTAGNMTMTSLGARALRVNVDNARSSEGFREMIAGEYPSFDEALATLVPDSSIAVCREYALLMSSEGYTTIYHKRDPLGLVMRGSIYLREDRQYAREALTEEPALPNDILNL